MDISTIPMVLAEGGVALHAIVALLSFGSMFCSLTEMPLFLAVAPYNLSPALTGLCYMAMGVAGIIASPLGGKLSDAAAATHPAAPLARLMYNTAISGLLLPCSLLLFGWALHFKLHLAVILVAQFCIGAAACAYTPSLFGYLTAMKQQGAAAAAAGLHSTMFLASAVLVLVASAAASAMGVGAFFSLLAGLNLLSAAVAGQQIYRQVASNREADSSMLPKLQQSSAVADDVADLHEDRGIGKAGSPAPVVLVVDARK
ncbi:hypothetical protein OEZ86_006937 [Tetradesmus obliquus]|nr:hypothetical protein OEZ86_006937 [Tetradesmus obliquus]